MLTWLRRMLARVSDHPPPSLPGPEAATSLAAGLEGLLCRDPARYRQFFLRGRPGRVGRGELDLFQELDRLGVVESLVGSWFAPRVRLFPLEGMFLATDLLARERPDQVFSLMFEQAYFVHRIRVGAGDRVLEIGAGSGVNALVARTRGADVVATDVSPRAVAFSRFNAALNGLSLDVREGSLFEPVSDRRFDVVLTNPPFEPAPVDADWPLHSHGGEDGLDVVRALLARLPDHLTPGGRLEMITWTTAGDRGLEIVPLLAAALPASAVHIETLTECPLGPLAERFRGSPGYADWRDRLAERGLDRVVMVFVRTAPAAEPAFTHEEPHEAILAARALADEW